MIDGVICLFCLISGEITGLMSLICVLNEGNNIFYYANPYE